MAAALPGSPLTGGAGGTGSLEALDKIRPTDAAAAAAPSFPIGARTRVGGLVTTTSPVDDTYLFGAKPSVGGLVTPSRPTSAPRMWI